MIEVEEKFELNNQALRQIRKHCDFVNKTKNHDIYFDGPDYKLSANDIWLRSRNKKSELKYPIKVAGHFNYKEYDEPEEIYKKLNLKYTAKDKNDFRKVLDKNGLIAIMDFESVRQKYKCGKFIIDIDNTNFGFGLFEVETKVENEADIEQAEKEIYQFIKNCGIKTKHLYSGKGVAYSRKFNPELLKVLIKAGFKIDG